MATLLRAITNGVALASLVALELQGKVTNIGKAESSPKKRALTQADLACQEIILNSILEYTSDLRFQAEEATRSLRRASGRAEPYEIVIDPLDGSLRYLGNDSSFGIQVGVIERGRYIAAVASLPSKDIILSAIAGEGAYLESESGPVRLRPADHERFVLCHDRVYEKERRRIKELGWTPRSCCGIEITTGPALGQAIAGLRPEYVSPFGRIGALISLEAGAVCYDGNLNRIRRITSEAINGLLIAATPEVAKSLITNGCFH